MLDTGATSILMNARLFAHENDGVEYVSWSRGTYSLTMHKPMALPKARLEKVRVGTEAFKRLLATVLEFHIDGEPVPGGSTEHHRHEFSAQVRFGFASIGSNSWFTLGRSVLVEMLHRRLLAFMARSKLRYRLRESGVSKHSQRLTLDLI